MQAHPVDFHVSDSIAGFDASTTLLHLLVLNGLGGADPFAVLPRPPALISSSVLEGPTQMVLPGAGRGVESECSRDCAFICAVSLVSTCAYTIFNNSRLRSSVRSRVTSSLYPIWKRRDAADS